MTMSKSITTIKYDNGVARVTLNRPERHNAFDDAMIKELNATFIELDQDPIVRVMVLASEGNHFSAGADLDWMQRMASYDYDANLLDAKALANMLHTLNGMSTPTIARVQGAAFGGAVGLVSCCDLAVGTQAANFCLSEVKVGLIPATISPYVIAAIGARAARRYFLTAERFSAESARQLGLLSDVVADNHQLDSRVDELINHLLFNSPAAVSAAKHLVFDVSNRAITPSLMDETSKRIAAIRVSDEGQEGLSAFLEKRKPYWQDGESE